MHELVGAAIDIETTGLEAGKHEIIDLSVIIHDDSFKSVSAFNTKIRPMHPEYIDVEALTINRLSVGELQNEATPQQARNAFFQWHENILEGKKIVPLGHNYAFDMQFLKLFFGRVYDELFYYKFRDTFVLAQALVDCELLAVDQSLSLTDLCELFVIPHNGHTAYGDAWAAMHLYASLLTTIKEGSITGTKTEGT